MGFFFDFYIITLDLQAPYTALYVINNKYAYIVTSGIYNTYRGCRYVNFQQQQKKNNKINEMYHETVFISPLF